MLKTAQGALCAEQDVPDLARAVKEGDHVPTGGRCIACERYTVAEDLRAVSVLNTANVVRALDV